MQNHLTLGQAANRSPGRPSANAVWRWCRKGILSRSGKRIRLNHVRVGGRIFTDPESLDRFFVEVAEADAAHFDAAIAQADHCSRPISPSRRQREIERTERELQDAGI